MSLEQIFAGLIGTYLSSDSVATSGEKLRDTRCIESSLGQTECGSKTGTTSTPAWTYAISNNTRHSS